MKPHFCLKPRITGFVVSGLCAAVLIPHAGAQPQDRTRPLAVIPPIVAAPVANVAAIGLSASAAKMPILVEKL
ncbi:hypothetical protein B1R32_103119 [Abditibacterium utsteinense]|uniref:Uncharacterized protein n=1 Tax=Abditibacterium utsteinense TaxID=1960156 RepID=A0A2S8SVP3_9BACT|nr:hypothetical protein [Abditibacterium utsteinense]PQV64852.1 hypothetical protein B1R32_103119 [Abditibacterium utsteinense]